MIVRCISFPYYGYLRDVLKKTWANLHLSSGICRLIWEEWIFHIDFSGGSSHYNVCAKENTTNCLINIPNMIAYNNAIHFPPVLQKKKITDLLVFATCCHIIKIVNSKGILNNKTYHYSSLDVIVQIWLVHYFRQNRMIP